ncbi:hypothetical protein VQ7734_01869 [Vibrio quintilis]|uniref:Uncharacterized protein n=1 Tax=Vibrio quintilis TaxID=1117707 RepID=A0A1M7YUD6_9VIBR|nr:hypothetical protein VQ7734_01869 [Vibrio quintilis]
MNLFFRISKTTGEKYQHSLEENTICQGVRLTPVTIYDISLMFITMVNEN